MYLGLTSFMEQPERNRLFMIYIFMVANVKARKVPMIKRNNVYLMKNRKNKFKKIYSMQK